MSSKSGHHELSSLNHHVEGSSDRSFGLVFAAVCALVAGYSAWHGGTWWPLALVLSAGFLGFALARPAVLAPLNRWWTRLGLLLGAIVAPIVMAIIYFGLITPMAAIARLAGKDFLRLRCDPAATTYWLPRAGPVPSRDSLRDQF